MFASMCIWWMMEGNEVQFGFWILTNAVFFVTDSIYWSIQKLLKKCRNSDKPEIEIVEDKPDLKKI